MRVDALDRLDPLTGQRDERQPDGHENLPGDPDPLVEVLEQEVVGLPDRAGQRVLDRRNPGADPVSPVPNRLEDRTPRRHRHRLRRPAPIPVDRLLRERPRLALDERPATASFSG